MASKEQNRLGVAAALFTGEQRSSGAMRYESGKIYSYSQCIAEYGDGGAIELHTECYRCNSVTTKGHLRALRQVLRANGWKPCGTTADGEVWA